jgi:hypothetical protein
MNLYEKTIALYPELTENDFDRSNEATGIVIAADLNGNLYFESWNHPTLTQPTQEQLDAVSAE